MKKFLNLTAFTAIAFLSVNFSAKAEWVCKPYQGCHEAHPVRDGLIGAGVGCIAGGAVGVVGNIVLLPMDANNPTLPKLGCAAGAVIGGTYGAANAAEAEALPSENEMKADELQSQEE